jgi:hypothetical protein
MEDIIDIIVTETTNTIEITAQPNDEIIDVNIIDNREDVTLNVTPTVVEININSLTGNFGVEWGDITGTLADQEDLQDALDLKADLVDGKVPSSQLPSYVDDVVEVATFSALPATGEIGKIYVILDTNKIYRWSGSVYVEIADSTAVWGAITGTLSSQTDLQSALDAKLSVTTAASTYVPYTGATANVNLGTRDLTADAIYVTNMTAGDGAIFAGGTLLTIANWNPDGRIAFRVDAGEVAVIINKDKTVSFYSAISATFATFTEVLTGTSAVFNAITADYGISLTNIHDSSQGLLVRATDNDADLFLLRLQSSNGATSETWVDRFTVSKSGVATFSNSVTANSFIKSGGTSSQFLKADGSIDSSTYLTTSSASSTYVPYTGATANVDLGTNDLTSRYLVAAGASALGGVVSMRQDATYLAKGNGYSSIASSGVMFDFFGYTGASTYKNFSLRFDGLTDNTLRTYTLPDASGTLALTSDLSSYVPYTGATGNVDLGTHTLLAAKGTFSSSGNSDTVGITHSSGSGISLNITKGGNGEGIYVNKSSGSGNAVTIVGTLNATTLVKNGGTSSQFLKADGSVDSSTYALDSAVVHLSGVETITGLKYFFAGSKHDLLFVSETVGYASIAGYSHFKANTNHIEFINSTNTKATKFIHGNAAYEFTMPNSSGTIALTSNLSAYLPLSGGTLTGNLAITANSARLTVSESGGAEIRVTAGGSSGFIGTYSNHSLAFLTNSATALTLASTGAATFSSSVFANSRIAVFSTGYGLFHADSSSYNTYIDTRYISADNGYLLETGKNGANAIPYLALGTGDNEKMRITSGGDVLIGLTATDVGRAQIQASQTGGSYGHSLLLKDSSTLQNALLISHINGETRFMTTYSGSATNCDLAFWTTISNGTQSQKMKIKANGIINLSNVPTSSAGLSTGDLYQVAGAVMIV